MTPLGGGGMPCVLKNGGVESRERGAAARSPRKITRSIPGEKEKDGGERHVQKKNGPEGQGGEFPEFVEGSGPTGGKKKSRQQALADKKKKKNIGGPGERRRI